MSRLPDDDGVYSESHTRIQSALYCRGQQPSLHSVDALSHAFSHDLLRRQSRSTGRHASSTQETCAGETRTTETLHTNRSGNGWAMKSIPAIDGQGAQENV